MVPRDERLERGLVLALDEPREHRREIGMRIPAGGEDERCQLEQAIAIRDLLAQVHERALADLPAFAAQLEQRGDRIPLYLHVDDRVPHLFHRDVGPVRTFAR